MRLGMLPGQQRALQRAFKKADKFDHFRARTRRAFVGGGVAAIAAAATSFWVGVRAGRGEAAPTAQRQLDGPLRDKLDVAHRLATAPDDELRINAAIFLVILDAHGGDELLWAGFTRLARMADAGTTERDSLLVGRLLASAQRKPPPSFVVPWVEQLQRHHSRR